MTQIQLIQAIPTLNKIAEFQLPFKTAYEIYSFIKKANERREFFCQQEDKLIKEYDGSVGAQGQILIKDNKDLQDFLTKYEELKKIEIEDLVPLEIKISDLASKNLSAADISALDGVIKFIE